MDWADLTKKGLKDLFLVGLLAVIAIGRTTLIQQTLLTPTTTEVK